MGVHGKVHARISWDYWFKRILYYQVALIYVITRLVLNVSQVSTVSFFLSYLYSWKRIGLIYVKVMLYVGYSV